MFYWTFATLRMLPIPGEFVLAGHVYRLAADTGPLTLLAALVYAVYGVATSERFAR
ncbi:hypothetical protein PUN4_370098 [Paraburkholderia unamae]|nr:hypothetical protein PUN4_370098 [Paraburkholderia unamae]